jgi:hypothetical protein
MRKDGSTNSTGLSTISGSNNSIKKMNEEKEKKPPPSTAIF